MRYEGGFRRAASRIALPVALGLLGAAAFAFALVGSNSTARGIGPLGNGDFNSWPNPTSPAQWNLVRGTVTQETATVIEGSAARIQSSGSGQLDHQAVAIGAGDQVTAGLAVSGDGSAAVAIELEFQNSNLELIEKSTVLAVTPSTPFQPLEVAATAPPGAEYVIVRVRVEGAGFVIVDQAYLQVFAAPPTATPSPTLPPTSTATAATASQTATMVAGQATATATATKTQTPTKTPTGTRTPTVTKTPTPPKTPTPIKPKGTPTPPLATSTPTVAPGSGTGGLLANGDFEVVRDGKPAYWEKFGGTMLSTGDSAAGTFAACLESETTSTKWLYQVVSVEPGGWYTGMAKARILGGGSASIRVSWYASADGTGAQLSQNESDLADSGSWTEIATGPIQAPANAYSARFRLVLQPSGTGSACFDDAIFTTSQAPAPTALPTPDEAPVVLVPGPTAKAGATSTPPRQTGTSGTSSPNTLGVISSAAAGPTTLRISEIMSDPSQTGRDAAFEWVELVNAGSDPIDLGGWQLGDGTSSQTLASLVVPAGSYIVLGGSSVDLPSDVLFAVPPGGQIGNGLGNTGDLLRLTAPDGAVVDEVSYGDNVKVFDPAPPAPGVNETIGLRDPKADPARQNWSLTSRPTPGEPNEFPPIAVQAVAGEKTGIAGSPTRTSGQQESTPEVDTDNDSGGSGATSWMILGGIAGVSLGVAGAALAPKARKFRERFRGN